MCSLKKQETESRENVYRTEWRGVLSDGEANCEFVRGGEVGGSLSEVGVRRRREEGNSSRQRGKGILIFCFY
jgi:hypothetical protein